MKRRTKIIISITGITIVLLALLGLTYGFYLTSINGNTNAKSVQVTTGNMSIQYTDLSDEILNVVVEPGYETIKLFTVQNIGNINAAYHIYLDEVQNNFVRTQDIIYTLYRKSGNNTIDTDDLSDCTLISSGTFPTENTYIKVSESIPNTNDYYTYALKIKYVYSVENQNADQGHTFGTKVQIHADIINNFEDGTLAKTVIDNAITRISGTSLNYASLTIPAEQVNDANEKVLSTTQDDLGVSYYFRGNVNNNYLNFAGMCWRIVRIEGNGNIKLILEDSTHECNNEGFTGNWTIGNTVVFGNDSNNRVDYLYNTAGNQGLANTFQTYQQTTLSTKIANTYTGKTIADYLSVDEWCYDDVIAESDEYFEFYGAATRLDLNKNPSLKCTGTKLTKFSDDTSMYVGTLTADEVAFAGLIYDNNNNNNYLLNNYTNTNFINWWTMSPYYFYSVSYCFYVHYNGYLKDIDVLDDSDYFARPVISLISEVEIITGDGTIENPYVVS